MSDDKRALSEEHIVDVAMQLLREQGVEKLSMRLLSTRLGVAVGATYRHVNGKQELLTLCLHRIFAEADRPRQPDEDPRAWVRELLLRLFDVMSGYPGMSSWSANNAILEPVSLTPSVVEALIEAGMDQEEASRTMKVLFFFVIGALTADYQTVMTRVGIPDYLSALRGDIEHILRIPSGPATSASAKGPARASGKRKVRS
jgi:AcrR family transcriptional regulator